MSKRTNLKTSLCAYRDAQDMIQTHHIKILEALRELEFANYESIAKACGIEKHGVGRRLSELELAHKIFKSGIQKPTSTGRMAFCYCLTSHGSDEAVAIEKRKKYLEERPKPPVQQNIL